MSDTPKPHLAEVPKVTVLPVITSLDLPTERILQGAIDYNDPLQSCIVIGYTAEGTLYFASSVAGGPETLWMLEKCKQRLLDISED